LKYSPLKSSDFDKEELYKLFMMSLRSESSFVRLRALLNLYFLNYEVDFVNQFAAEILKLKSNPPKNFTERELEYIDKVLNKE
jgi:glutaminyl-tRNA synthetase